MQHGHHFGDNRQAVRRNLKPGIEGLDQLAADIFARVLVHVLIRTHQYLLICRRPRSILDLGAIVDTRFVPFVLVFRWKLASR